MEKICMSQKRIDEIRAICKEHGNDPGELINILHTVQGKLGYLPKEVQELIAMELGIPAAKVYGVVTFYSFFTMKPKGKYPISVCMGTACYVRGAEKVLDEFKRQLALFTYTLSGFGDHSNRDTPTATRSPPYDRDRNRSGLRFLRSFPQENNPNILIFCLLTYRFVTIV